MKTVLITLVMWAKLTTWGVEDDGTVNHLLETATGPNPQMHLSFSAEDALPIMPNVWTKIVIRPRWKECQEGFGVDDFNTGTVIIPVSRRSYICNVNKLEINGEIFTTNDPVKLK